MSQITKANLLMLMAAAIWGSAFVAQRVGMETMGPHLFNAVRFLIGGVTLVPVLIWLNRRKASIKTQNASLKTLLLGGLGAGLLLLAGASFQQMGLQYTTAGKAGFITGLYVFFVPLIGLLYGMRTGVGTWLGAGLALWGLYLLSVQADLSLSRGDSLVLLCAVCFAGHVLAIGHLVKRIDPIRLSLVQFFVAGTGALLLALATEVISWQSIQLTAIPLLYAGVLSTGVAYTLQVMGQEYAHPAHAAIILSSEGVFAALGGWLLLQEVLPVAGLVGCALMLTGMLVSQLMPDLRKGLVDDEK